MGKLNRLLGLRVSAGSAALLIAAASSAVAAPALDPGFGEGGVVRTPLPEPIRQAIANTGRAPLIEGLAVRPGGELVGVLGSAGVTPFLGAVGYRAGGGLDSNFGSSGFTDLEGAFRGIAGEGQGEAAAAAPDGKVVIAGYRGHTGFRDSRPRSTAPLLVKLRADGRPDRSFGSRGLVTSRPQSKNGEVLHAVALQGGGRIVAVGARNELRGGKPAGLVIAYRANGSIDRRFGSRGRVLIPHRRVGYTALRDIAVLSSGKLLVAGYLGDRFVVARLYPDGALDRGFGHGGKVLLGSDLGACCPSEAALAPLHDGDVLALSSPLGEGQAVYRLNPDGGIDRHFARRGILRGAWLRRGGEIAALAIQGDGRIVITGTLGRRRGSSGEVRRVVSILRALPNGKPDRSFGSSGAWLLSPGYNAVATSTAAAAHGRVVVAGGDQILAARGAEGDFEYEMLLARLRR